MVFAPVRAGNGAKLSSAGLWLNASKPESVLETMMLGPAHVSCVEIELVLVYQIWWIFGGLGGNYLSHSSTNCNHNMGGGESFADDLNGNGVL